MEIRKATVEDIEAIEEINRKYVFETGRDYAKIISATNKGILVITDGAQMAGFLGHAFEDWNETLKIINIFILPEFRHKGLASQLVQYLIESVKDKDYRTILTEAPSKSFAPKLYQKNGFRKCGYNDRYYDNTGEEIAEFYSYDLIK
jgi:ribosomal protein S18 acetylase RimI-like enzyme